MVLINRNPFAREELHREPVVLYGDGCCEWCGQQRKPTKHGTRYLYQYSTQTDGGRTFTHKGLFCCKSCHDSFHS